VNTAENFGLIPLYCNCSYLLCPFGQSVYHPFACLLNHTEQKPILVLKQHMWVIKFLKYIPGQISLTIINEKQINKIWLCKVYRRGQMMMMTMTMMMIIIFLFLLLLQCLYFHVRCLVIKTPCLPPVPPQFPLMSFLPSFLQG